MINIAAAYCLFPNRMASLKGLIMADTKTVPTRASVDKFLKGITDEKKRTDCYRLLEIMKKATHAEPKMWGTSIVGFGRCHQTVGSGQGTDGFITAFSPCNQNLTIYLMSGFDQLNDLRKQLGKHSASRNCIHINRLEDVDPKILKELISRSVNVVSKK